MKTIPKKVTIIVEKTDSGFSARLNKKLTKDVAIQFAKAFYS